MTDKPRITPPWETGAAQVAPGPGITAGSEAASEGGPPAPGAPDDPAVRAAFEEAAKLETEAKQARRAAIKARRAAVRAERSAAGLPPNPPGHPDKAHLRATGGTWAPGQSGNPAGPKVGTTHGGADLRLRIGAKGQEITDKVIALALGGDLTALRMCLDRIAPPARPEGRRVNFAFDAEAPLTAQAQQVIKAVAQGEISVEDGTLIVQALSSAASLRVADQVEERLRALEGRKPLPGAKTGGMVLLDIDPATGNMVEPTTDSTLQ